MSAPTTLAARDAKGMSDLAKYAIDAHGGLDRWRQFKTVSAHLLQGGALWKLKGQEGALKDVRVTVGLRSEVASHSPFPRAEQHSSFTPDRIAIESDDGAVLHERFNPRESFKGHTLETPWDNLQLAYFAGYAMWTYMNTPFLFALPGVQTQELEPWEEDGEVWRRLKVKFPPGMATHSAEQTFYFDQRGLLKRHDYNVDVSGGTPAVHYTSELEEFSGIMVPTRHMVFGRQPNGKAVLIPLIVSIALSDIEFDDGRTPVGGVGA